MGLRIAIVGYGRMGRSVERLAPEHGCEVVRIFRSAENGNGAALTQESLAGADVAIEFTTPVATPHNIRRLVEFGVPVVTGTTGWFEEISQIREITAAKNGSVVWGPNFSVGLHHFRAVVTEAARRAGSVTGTHEIGFDSSEDTITLRHTARSRDGFVRGALRAARWLAGKRGFFEFREIVNELP